MMDQKQRIVTYVIYVTYLKRMLPCMYKSPESGFCLQRKLLQKGVQHCFEAFKWPKSVACQSIVYIMVNQRLRVY